MDIKLMLKKKAELENKAKGNEIFFKPQEGETVIRIVPLASDPDNPFQELQFHYNFEGKTILSPRSIGEVDPIADFSDSLIRGGNLTKEEYKEIKKKYSPVVRTYVPVVVRGAEKEGVKFWAFGKTIFEQLLSIIADEDYGDITDAESGHDIKITFTPQEKSDTNFAKTELMVRPKKTPLSPDKDVRTKWLTEQPVLIDAFKKWTKTELDELLSTNLNPATEETPAPVVSTDNWDTVAEVKPKLSEETKQDFSALFD